VVTCPFLVSTHLLLFGIFPTAEKSGNTDGHESLQQHLQPTNKQFVQPSGAAAPDHHRQPGRAKRRIPCSRRERGWNPSLYSAGAFSMDVCVIWSNSKMSACLDLRLSAVPILIITRCLLLCVYSVCVARDNYNAKTRVRNASFSRSHVHACPVRVLCVPSGVQSVFQVICLGRIYSICANYYYIGLETLPSETTYVEYCGKRGNTSRSIILLIRTK
jgi:hypothetical protein